MSNSNSPLHSPSRNSCALAKSSLFHCSSRRPGQRTPPRRGESGASLCGYRRAANVVSTSMSRLNSPVASCPAVNPSSHTPRSGHCHPGQPLLQRSRDLQKTDGLFEALTCGHVHMLLCCLLSCPRAPSKGPSQIWIERG